MISTRKLVVLALGLVAGLVACSDDGGGGTRPTPPLQIQTSITYTQSSNGLTNSDVYAFLVLSSGEFWIGTEAGIAKYPDTNTDTRPADAFVDEITGLPHRFVRCMAEYNGKVYVGTWGGGIGVYDIAGDTWSQFRPAKTGLTDGFISDLAVSPTEDRLYFSSNDGVFILDPNTNTFTHVDTPDADLLAIPDENLTPEMREIIAVQRLIPTVEVTENGGTVERWYGPRVETRVSDATLKRVGILVSKGASTTYKYTPVNSGLVEPNVNDIYYDSATDSYWVSYVSRGISQVSVPNATWTNYTLVQGLPSNTVYSITRAADNSNKNNSVIWAATQGGLAKLVNGKWQGYGLSGGLPSDRVRRVYSDDGVRLWVGLVEAGAVRIKI